MTLVITLLLSLINSLVPTPIGPGARYLPSASTPPVGVGCNAGSLKAGGRIHIELFANRRVIVVPAAIGVRSPRLSLGRVVGSRCRAPIWTSDPSGVVHFAGPATLGDVFHVWQRSLTPRRLLSFRGRVHVYIGGRAWNGDPRRLRLRGGSEIVLEVRGYIPPHRSFLFPAS